jgi:hypothetical protein
MAPDWQFFIVRGSCDRLMLANLPPLALFQVHTFGGTYVDESPIFRHLVLLKINNGDYRSCCRWNLPEQRLNLP